MHQKKGSPKFPGVVFNVAEYYFCMYSREERKKKENSGRRNYGLTRMVAVVAGLRLRGLRFLDLGGVNFFLDGGARYQNFGFLIRGLRGATIRHQTKA